MRRMLASRRFRLLLEIAAIVLVLLAVRAYTQRGVVHGTAPSLAGPLLDGGRADLAALRGRPVLVHFWATWCPVCRLELSSIDAIAKDYTVITVAQQSGSAASIRAYLKKHDVDFPVVADPDGVLSRRFGVRAVPASFVIGPRGRIRFVEVGYTTGLGLRARLWWVR